MTLRKRRTCACFLLSDDTEQLFYARGAMQRLGLARGPFGGQLRQGSADEAQSPRLLGSEIALMRAMVGRGADRMRSGAGVRR